MNVSLNFPSMEGSSYQNPKSLKIKLVKFVRNEFLLPIFSIKAYQLQRLALSHAFCNRPNLLFGPEIIINSNIQAGGNRSV